MSLADGGGWAKIGTETMKNNVAILRIIQF
jgi:hypothetical protein